MIPYVTIRGTWGDGKKFPQFDLPNTSWSNHMRNLGCYPIGGQRPFRWTTDLEGDDREVAGDNFYNYIVPPLAPEYAVPPTETHVLTYSFGNEPALWAAAKGLKIRTLITVGGPVRKDMREVVERARPNIYHWICVYSDGDWMQHFGTWFDKEWNPFRPMPKDPLCDLGVRLPRRAGHGGVYYDPNWFPVWTDILVPNMRSNHVEDRSKMASVAPLAALSAFPKWMHENRPRIGGYDAQPQNR